METLQLAEQHGINTVFETGAEYVRKYNQDYGGHMQFIPHIEVQVGQSEQALKDHIKKQVDTGAVALYVWGVAGDTLVRSGAIDRVARAVELAKAWRTDRALRRLEALLAVADRANSLIITGNGDVLEPEFGIVAIGSGGAYAQAAARALLEHTALSAAEIVKQSLTIAADLCIYTNQHHTIETLP